MMVLLTARRDIISSRKWSATTARFRRNGGVDAIVRFGDRRAAAGYRYSRPAARKIVNSFAGFVPLGGFAATEARTSDSAHRRH